MKIFQVIQQHSNKLRIFLRIFMKNEPKLHFFQGWRGTENTEGKDSIERKFRGELINRVVIDTKTNGAKTYAWRESDQGCEMCGAGSGSEPRDTGPARAANNRFIHNETMTRLQAY